MSSQVLACQKVSKTYIDGRIKTPVLHDLSFEINAGEMVAIVGKSGSGKSTLLHLLGGLDTVTSGDVFVMGESLKSLSINARGKLRNAHLGFVYQFHHLLPEFNAIENVMMPLLIRGQHKKQARLAAQEILDAVGLSHRLTHKPSALSGGERQRVAIARALVTQPACILADEPTGNLDTQTAEEVFEIMHQMNQQFQTSFVIVTHDQSIASKMQRVLTIEDGRLIGN